MASRAKICTLDVDRKWRLHRFSPTWGNGERIIQVIRRILPDARVTVKPSQHKGLHVLIVSESMTEDICLMLRLIFDDPRRVHGDCLRRPHHRHILFYRKLSKWELQRLLSTRGDSRGDKAVE